MTSERRLYVTGAAGFVGSTITRLAESLLTPLGFVVVSGAEVDVLQTNLLETQLRALQPDYVIHLAALSSVRDSFSNPDDVLRTNLFGTLSLLKAIKAARPSCRMLYVGTGDVYGKVDTQALPVSEIQPLRPRNPYAVSKVAAEALCFQASQSDGLDIVMARPFNHIGPGQSAAFVISSFARQIAEIRQGQREAVLRVGNLDVTRDFTDVRDVIRAYLLLLLQGRSGEVYNVCSGTETKISDALDALLSIAGVEARFEVDRKELRPAEQPRMAGDSGKILAETGWRPEISLRHTLEEMLHHWSKELNHD